MLIVIPIFYRKKIIIVNHLISNISFSNLNRLDLFENNVNKKLNDIRLVVGCFTKLNSLSNNNVFKIKLMRFNVTYTLRKLIFFSQFQLYIIIYLNLLKW